MNNAFANAFGPNVLISPGKLGDTVLERGRGAAIAAAHALDRAKTPSHKLAEAGLRANAVAHDGVARLMTNQVQFIDGWMDEGVRRLELIAEARSLRTLVEAQIELLADTRARLSNDAERTLAILADVGTRLGEVFRSAPAQSAAEQVTPAPRIARTRHKKAVTRKKTVARKTAQKRAPRRNTR